MRSLIVCLTAALVGASPAWADPVGAPSTLFSNRPLHDGWAMSWPSCSGESTRTVPGLSLAFPSTLLHQDNSQPLHAAAIEHSEAFQTRAKIHKYASFATLPLFAAELALGQTLYSGASTSNKAAHGVVGAGIVGLFGVNTVTGAWNMFGEEGRQEKEGRTLRLIHGLLMMASDVGMVATEASAPSTARNRALQFQTSKVTHRNIAIASVSTATLGYLIMLFGNH